MAENATGDKVGDKNPDKPVKSVKENSDVPGGPTTPEPPAPAAAPRAPVAATAVVTAAPAESKKEKSNEEKLMRAFTRKVGGDYADLVDQVNVQNRVLTTTNGGKYRILRGGEIQTLAGPIPPDIAEEERSAALEAEKALDED